MTCAQNATHPVCARITHENSRQGVQPLEQRWVATAIVTRIDELFASTPKSVAKH
jgi:hypothetical protein